VAEHLVDQHDHDYSDEEYEHAKNIQLPVMVAKIDCVIHKDVCAKQHIMAYPTLRLFVEGERWRAGDYRIDRTVVAMADWLQQIEDTHKTELESDENKNVQLVHEGEYRLDAWGLLEIGVASNHVHCSLQPPGIVWLKRIATMKSTSGPKR
jgi:hypothetical protein